MQGNNVEYVQETGCSFIKGCAATAAVARVAFPEGSSFELVVAYGKACAEQ